MKAVHIPLSRGVFAVIDEADLHLVSGIKWHAQPVHRASGGFYAVNGRGGAKPTQFGRRYMHRVIMGASEHQIVDHINGDGLDNRRSNLRICDASTNCVNRQYVGSTGHRGVERTASGKYRAKITFHGRVIRSGLCLTAHAAAIEYDILAAEYFGSAARLNFRSAA